jgi:hypothetical protein
MVCPRQSVPEATSESGEVTDAPLTGLDTTTLVVVDVDVPWMTVIFTSVGQEAPLFPHDLTCNTWLPRDAETLAAMDVPEATVVLELLSSEKPIDAIVCDEQGPAFAAKAKGEVTVAPFAGLLTVTLARAGAA